MRISPANIQRLPFELRSQILAYTIDEHVTSLTIPPRDQDSWLEDLRKQLPPWLHLEDEEWDETTNVLIRHMLCVVTELTMADPEDLLCEIPPSMQLTNVRSLTYTRPQNGYSKTSATSDSSVYDVVRRCPQLQELTLPIHAAGLIEDYRPDFDYMFEHQSVMKLHLQCTNAPMAQSTYYRAYGPDAEIIQPFEGWFLGEAKARGRHMALSIDLTPNARYNQRDPQCCRRELGCMKWIEYQDWFG